jgi:lipid-A-disaccharide synthase
MRDSANGAATVVGIVAGEASGDFLGAHLIAALRERRPDLRFEGIGGTRMVAAGATALYPMEKLAVRGYIEVLRHYREILGIRKALEKHFVAQRPALFIGIDAPDFNLDLEVKLRATGIKIVHYVSPSIWAWRAGRIDKIKRAVDRMLCVFPFESDIYDKAQIDASYVGHPLADVLADYPSRQSVRAKYGIEEGALVVALLPGSRVSELEAMAGLFVATAARIAVAHPQIEFLAPMVNRATRTIFESALANYPTVRVRLFDGQSHDSIKAADVVLVASGTATLETALLGRAMVITYRMPRVSWWLMKNQRYQPWIGLPNILARDFVVPEILQSDATPDRLAHAILELLDNEARRSSIEAQFAEMSAELRCNSAQRAADAILPMLPAVTV